MPSGFGKKWTGVGCGSTPLIGRAKVRRIASMFTGHQQVPDTPTVPVNIVGRVNRPPKNLFTCRYNGPGDDVWRNHMANRPSNLAKQISDRREPDDGYLRETFRLPVEVARVKPGMIVSDNGTEFTSNAMLACTTAKQGRLACGPSFFVAPRATMIVRQK
jgi:hypothetical protein